MKTFKFISKYDAEKEITGGKRRKKGKLSEQRTGLEFLPDREKTQPDDEEDKPQTKTRPSGWQTLFDFISIFIAALTLYIIVTEIAVYRIQPLADLLHDSIF